ncbi:MAG: DUF2085 domain-containing protein [Acidobacteriota bacterium]
MKKRDASPGRNSVLILIYVLTGLGTVLWMSGIFLAPYVASQGSPLRSVAYAVYSNVCHQIPARSFQAFGQPLAVCARCLGIYAGFLFGVGLYPFVWGFRRLSLPETKVFVFISLPVALDTASNFLGLWGSPNGLRFTTGLLWGAILPFYFITGLADLVLTLKYRLKSKKSSP